MRILFLFLFSLSSYAQTVLIIGDSHMTNPLGEYLYDSLSKRVDRLEIRGNAGSAPMDWLGKKTSYLTGGTYKASSGSGEKMTDPKSSKPVPKLKKLLNDIQPSLVLVELGANDVKAITNAKGIVNPTVFMQRLEYAQKMVQMIRDAGARCFWVGPPNGASKTAASQKVIYQMLRRATAGACEFIETDQKKVYASGKSRFSSCDGYHFHCTRKQRAKVYVWSQAILRSLGLLY